VKSVCNPSSLEIKSCPGQAPASGKATLHTSRRSQEEPDVAHQQLVQGLSVAEVVEAGEVPAKVGTLLHFTQWAKCVLGMICTCIKDRNPTEQIYSTSFALTLLLPHLIVVGVSGGVILAAL